MNAYENSQVKVKSRGFISNLQRVREQINFQYLVREYQLDEMRQINEFCSIIADVLTLPPHALIKIDGEERYAEGVQEVYELLDERHIETVLENFNNIAYKIKNPKTYIRTALYNSYFELENKSANETNVRFAEND